MRSGSRNPRSPGVVIGYPQCQRTDHPKRGRDGRKDGIQEKRDGRESAEPPRESIGIVVPEAVTTFYLKFTTAVQRILQPQGGYRIILAISDEDFLSRAAEFRGFDNYASTEFLISSCHHRANLEFYMRYVRHCTPMVFFDRTVADLECSSVRSDDYHSAFFLVEHLVYQGYRRILHLAGPDYIRNTAERLWFYRDVLKNTASTIVRSSSSRRASTRWTERMREPHPQCGVACDAIFWFYGTPSHRGKKSAGALYPHPGTIWLLPA